MTGQSAPIRYYKGVPVPYIAAWSAEKEGNVVPEGFLLRENPFTGQSQLRYRDEHPADRDRHGILWHRVAWAPGEGEPAFAEVHTVRQRRALHRSLCQICGNPGVLWLTPALLWDAHLADNGPRAPYRTSDPPVCRSCYELALRYCPELGRGKVILAPGRWAITAVRGQIADPRRGGFSDPRTIDLPGMRGADYPALSLVLAKGLVASLYHPRAVADPDAVTGLGVRVDPPPSTA